MHRRHLEQNLIFFIHVNRLTTKRRLRLVTFNRVVCNETDPHVQLKWRQTTTWKKVRAKRCALVFSPIFKTDKEDNNRVQWEFFNVGRSAEQRTEKKKERQQSSAKEQNARATMGLHVVAVKTVNHFRRAWRKISLQACNPFFSRVCVTISNSAIPFTWRNRHESSKENRNDYVTAVTGVSCFYTGSTYLTTLFTLLYLFRPVKFKQTAYDLFLNWVNRNPPLGDLWIARMFFLNEYERLWERNARFTLENYQQLPWVYFFVFLLFVWRSIQHTRLTCFLHSSSSHKKKKIQLFFFKEKDELLYLTQLKPLKFPTRKQKHHNLKINDSHPENKREAKRSLFSQFTPSTAVS